MSRTSVKLALVLGLILALAVAGTALGGGGPGGGGPGGGGPGGGGPGGGGPGGGGEETATNNLSVPLISIGGSFTGVTIPGGLVYPSGTPLTGYEVPGYFFVQGVHKWQAEAITASAATATAEWGDNLAGEAKLQLGKPIRVELGLFDDTVLQMQGFNVVKLEPSKLDRESAYGTLATSDGLGGWYATAEVLPARVFDAGVTFSVKNVATGAYAVPEGSNPTAEINATGRVVYGYNLRVDSVGQYEITFVIPSVDITGVDVGTYATTPLGEDTVTLVITVGGGGGGGGKGGR